MKIIKPYGRSHVEKSESGGRERVLRTRVDPGTAADIEEFAQANDRLVIAQWISAIDKIATKPTGTKGPTPEQRAFRERLGDAAWVFIKANGLLGGLTNSVIREHLTKLWKVKIAPYGDAQYKAQGKPGRELPPPSSKGRWYDRFVGDEAVADVDAAAVARRIYEHLYTTEYRISTDAPRRKHGRISSRAKSIAVNVSRVGSSDPEAGWTAEDRESYARPGNIAQEIRSAAQRREKGEDKAGTRRVTSSVAGAELFKHYARVFHTPQGEPLCIRDARERSPGLFNLHMAVKDCYSRILKHHRKGQKAHATAQRKMSELLPDSMKNLFALVDSKNINRDLSSLIRLGKVIHYEASGNALDRTIGPLRNWPDDISGSIFWTSDGQTMIKRNEAFVRVWRHVLALASWTLRDWTDPKGLLEGDILLARAIELAVRNLFNSDNYVRKLDLLFGNRANLFKHATDDAFQRNVLRLALEGLAALRHSAFHFKGLGTFADALRASGLKIDMKVLDAIRQLWETDARERVEQLLKTMRSANFEYFLDEAQNRKLLAACTGDHSAPIPLPRFRRVLQRAQNAWSEGKDDIRLPEPANRTELESPVRLCQYTALKLLYERAFRSWLPECTALVLNGFIDRAIERATAAARDLNPEDDVDRRDMIAAKAANLGRLAEDDDVGSFFFNLSAETASEMRVQRGYASDPDRAREQAGYIENLKSDVVGLAFGTFLREVGFEFLLGLSLDNQKPAQPLYDLSELPPQKTEVRVEDWQALLYFLIHLAPVEEVGLLLHQMRKWQILAARPSGATSRYANESMSSAVLQVHAVLELYLDMHDAKFQGGAKLIGSEAFKELFETAGLFDKIFPKQIDNDDDYRIPRRGLREIMRFGHLPVLRAVFMQHTVKSTEVSQYLQAEGLGSDKSGIAAWQELRESLHDKWTRTKREFLLEDVRSYVEALSNVVRHRHLSAHVTLTDHVKLHRLLMTVLGRLVDYSGLWERDLYFVTLALAYESGCRLGQVFTNDGLQYLGKGQIVSALDNRQQSAEAHAFAGRLNRYFGKGFERGSSAVKIRNEFAHFNMLKPASLPVDLSACVNNARYLVAHDRKLKNAVSKSIKEKLHREGLVLDWTMEATGGHQLGPATLKTRQARHLGKTTLREKGASNRVARPKSYPIVENLHSDHFVSMVAALFGSCAPRYPRSLVDIRLDSIDWQSFGGEHRSRTERVKDDTGIGNPGTYSQKPD
jgi:hypothetical protein